MCINSESAIDLILVSDHEKVCQSGDLSVGLSDHMLIIVPQTQYSSNSVF